VIHEEKKSREITLLAPAEEDRDREETAPGEKKVVRGGTGGSVS